MSIKIPTFGVYLEIHSKYQFYTKKDKDVKEDETFKFDTMADMLIMAALTGFYLKNYKPFNEHDKIERAIPWKPLLNNDSLMQIIKSICLLHVKENPKGAKILLDNEDMSKIIEGYANGGIHHLIKKMEEGIDMEGNILSLIMENNDQFL